MDRVDRYRQIVRDVMKTYASWTPSNDEVATEIVVDPDRDHYEMLRIGWHDRKRVYGTLFHIDIINGKIWIQYDGTNRPVAEELLAAGIPREDIVLAFHPADLRKHTEFAVG